MAAAPRSVLHPRNPVLGTGTLFQGGYEILAELGTGTSGRVYKARQLSTGQAVAIKLLHLLRSSTPDDARSAIERFQRETRLGSELCHPNIVPLIDSGESDDGALYAVFQYVPGSTLRTLLAEEGALELDETLHLMTQVLDALSCAHARGIVHRDLKPENIMVTRTGVRRNALVLDFGLGGFVQDAQARLLPRITATQEMMGTPCYAAPEQLRGERPSTRADLYSWGLITLECLTGAIAVNGATAQEVILKQIGPDPVPIPSWLPDVRLRRILETVTAKAIEKRDVTIEGLVHALATIAPDGPAPSPAEAAAPADGERRQVTLVCCGLLIASPDGAAPDLEALDELLHAQHAMWTELAARHGGQIAGRLADRVLFAFGYPQAHETDARQAAHTALEIASEAERQRQRLAAERGLRLEVRVGVHTGMVVARQLRQGARQGLGDLTGLAPQAAVQLAALAAPGEVLVSSDAERLLRNQFACEAAGERRLDAGSEGAPVYRLLGAQRAVGGRDTFSFARETPLVGRSQQIDQLTERWHHAAAGHGSSVLITGEPGIGKSRLTRELRRRVPPDAWLECRCVAESADSPLRPVAEMLLAGDGSIEDLLTRYRLDLAEMMPLFGALCGLPPDDRFPLPQLSPVRLKELTLTALLALLARRAEAHPVVLLFEDLHWADPTTIELVTLLVHETHSARIVRPDHSMRLLLLLTARSEFTAPWSTQDVAQLQLARLDRGDVEAMVRVGVGGDGPTADHVMDEIVRRADGIPLFVEEVARVLVEHGSLAQRDDDSARAGGLQIPATLRGLLTARLDGLSPGARDTAQLAAILGREFRYEVLRAVSAKHESVLREDLRELTELGLAYHRRSTRSEVYVFKHALVCDVAYETLLRPARQRLHLRVATTLQQRFPDIAESRPETLAHHYELGEEIEPAVECWRRAGYRTLARGAYVESMRHFERGVALVRRQPESRQRLQRELSLTEGLGRGLIAQHGYAAPQVETTFARASQLCSALGGDVSLMVLEGIWGVRITRSDREATAELLPMFLRHADASTDPIAQLSARSHDGVLAFFTGDFARARDQMTEAVTWYRATDFRTLLQLYGYDGGLYAFAYLMWSLWILGHPDQALAVRDEMESIAQETRNPYSLALAWGFSANLAHDRGEQETVWEVSERDLALLREQKLYFWLGPATCSHGWAAVQRGDVDQGIEEIRQGLGLFHLVGLRATYSYHLALLAEAYLVRGDANAGLAVVEEALGLTDTLLDRFYAAELHRLQGELRRVRGDRAGAETACHTALDLARRQQARSFELRAALSLARLSAERGAPREGRALVAGVYGGFREGFDTRDLRDARALLDALA